MSKRKKKKNKPKQKQAASQSAPAQSAKPASPINEKPISKQDKVTIGVICFMLFLIPLFILTNMQNAYIIPKRIVYFGLTALAALLWFFRPAKNISLPTFRNNPFLIAIAAFCFWFAVCFIMAFNKFEAAGTAAHWGAGLFTAVFTFHFCRNEKPLVAIMAAIVAGGAGISGFALIQYFDITVLEPLGFPHIDQIAYNDRNQAKLTPVSTLGNQNYAAQFLVMSIPCGFALAAYSRSRKIRSVLYFSLFLMLFYFLLAKCRGAWVGLIFGCAALGLIAASRSETKSLIRKNKKTVLIIAGIFLAVAVILPFTSIDEGIKHRTVSVFNPDTQSNRTRLSEWSATLAMTGEHPVFGVGPGNFKIFYPIYRDPEERILLGARTETYNAHNDYFHIASEFGVPGLLLFGLIILAALRPACRFTLSNKSRKLILILGLFCGACGVLTHTFFSFPLYLPAASSAFWAIIGILAGLRFSSTPSQSQEPPNESPHMNHTFHPPEWSAPILYLVGIAFFCGAWIYNWKVGRADKHLSKGFILREQGKLNDAVVEFGSAAKLLPADCKIQFEYGQALTEASNIAPTSEERKSLAKSAINAFHENLKLQPHSEFAHKRIGDVYANLGENKKALDFFQIALSKNPQFEAARIRSGLIYDNMGLALKKNKAEAQKLFDKALKEYNQIIIEKGREKVQALYNIGVVYSHMGQVFNNKDYYKKSADYYKNVLKINRLQDRGPEAFVRCNIYLDQGRRYELAGQYKLALEAYKEAAKSGWGSLPYFAMGVVYTKMKNSEKAFQYFQKGLGQVNYPYAKLSGISEDAANNLGHVLEILGKKYKEDANSAKIEKEKIQLEEKAIQFERDAITEFNQRLRYNPHPLTCYNLGRLYLSKRDLDKALTYYSWCFSLAQPGFILAGNSQGPNICNVLANIHENRNEMRQAIFYWEVSVKQFPLQQNVSVLRHKIRINEKYRTGNVISPTIERK